MTTPGFRLPIVGEVVKTPKGEGIVLLVTSFDDHPKAAQPEAVSYLRSRLGRDFAQIYFHAEVEVDGDVTEYACWDLEYDAERDPEEAPWREPPSD